MNFRRSEQQFRDWHLSEIRPRRQADRSAQAFFRLRPTSTWRRRDCGFQADRPSSRCCRSGKILPYRSARSPRFYSLPYFQGAVPRVRTGGFHDRRRPRTDCPQDGNNAHHGFQYARDSRCRPVSIRRRDCRKTPNTSEASCRPYLSSNRRRHRNETLSPNGSTRPRSV